ncbi:MAG: sacsin N-terminal ATP-binding-like domain-containing protein, partial [Actinocrinis sp.]
GAPLDAAGVVGLSTLRASSKRDEWDASADPATDDVPTAGGPVGRFGVGFAAVLAVSDEPALLSRHGSVRFSAADARAAVQDVAVGNPGLGIELHRREGRVPALRLPFPIEGRPPQGYDTAVVLPLRDSAAEDLVRRLLTEIDDALMLALPQLSEIEVEVDGRTRTLTSRRGDGQEWVVTDGGRTTRWRLARAHGALDPLLLAQRPIEERARPYWSVTWAVPLDEDAQPLRPQTIPVVHAPTPTDEPLGLPALLIATFPLDPTRRHVAPGELSDFLLDQAAGAYARLLEQWPARTPGLLRLVPGPVAEGALDAGLRERIGRLLPQTAFLPAADGSREPLRPEEATVIVPCDELLVAALVDVLPGLLPAGWERDPIALGALRVRRLETADLVDTLSALRREPGWWGRLYAALDGVAGYDPGAREALASLPVPLADGRTVRGAPGTLLPDSDLDEHRLAALRPLGLRVVHPAALGPGAYGLLERLGARPAQPRAILADPAVYAAIAASADDLPQADLEAHSHPGAIAEAVLTLVGAADPRPQERFGLDALLLLDDQGRYTPARELLLPSSPLAEIVEPGAFGRVDAGWVRRWGPETLRAVGVLDTFTLVSATDVLLDPDGADSELFDLDGFEDWLDDVRDLLPSGARDTPPVAVELVAVRDLDLVAADQWPTALGLLAEGPLRGAVTEPIRVLTGGGATLRLPSYTSWWLSRHPVLDGRRPSDLSTGGGLLEGLYDQIGDEGAAAKADPQFLVGLGVRTDLAALLAAPGGPDELLDRLADQGRDVGALQLVELYSALAHVPDDRVAPPSTLRAFVAGRVELADAAQTAVVDAPDLLALLGDRPYLPVGPRDAERLADLLDLALASELVAGRVTSEGESQPVPDVILDLVPEAPDSYFEHEELLLDDGIETDWRVVDGEVHASTFDGLARALAWAAGRWDRRHLIAALLSEPERADELAAEAYFE